MTLLYNEFQEDETFTREIRINKQTCCENVHKRKGDVDEKLVAKVADDYCCRFDIGCNLSEPFNLGVASRRKRSTEITCSGKR